MPFISICIPAYKNPDFLQRLLQSISIQIYKDFEVIITDDSPDDMLQPIVNAYSSFFKIVYLKNAVPLGTPANWNFAISKANGQWIKLMHHDDWLAYSDSLKMFANAALNASCDFIFSGFTEVKANAGSTEYIINASEKYLLRRSPLSLFKKNFIGHPSTTLIRNKNQNWYDEKIKWVVDFEFYIRCLTHTAFLSIDKVLINIGIHDDQVTKQVFRKPEIEIPENLYLLNKLGEQSLRNIFVYDYYWRLFRNLGFRNIDQVLHFSRGNHIPISVKKMLAFQFKIPLQILKTGFLSKFLMLLSKTIQ